MLIDTYDYRLQALGLTSARLRIAVEDCMAAQLIGCPGDVTMLFMSALSEPEGPVIDPPFTSDADRPFSTICTAELG